jgi:uncharacterized protein (DUF4415 family)
METKPGVESSRREKLVVRSEADILHYLNSAKGKRERAQAKALGPDPTAKDLREIPELTDAELAGLTRLYRPRKERISTFLDVEILEWLKEDGPGYQTRLNEVLRDAMRRARARKRVRQQHAKEWVVRDKARVRGQQEKQKEKHKAAESRG